MVFDLSWLWDLLNTVVSTIQTWFSSLWGVAQNITNAGQGIFSGLVSFGSMLWDAIVKAFSTIGEWIYNAFKWLYEGFRYVSQVFGEWVGIAFSWIGSAISWVAQQIYNFGAWLYNGLTYVWNWIVNTAIGVWNAITGFFSGIASAIGSWWSSIISGINSWFTSLIVGLRNKIVQTIMADVSIYFGWKSMERLINAKSLTDAGFSLLGLLGSPFIGYMFGSIVNGLIPTPSTKPIQLIPEIAPFTYSPPSLTVETPPEKPAPSLGVPPTPVVIGAGLPYDITLPVLKAPSYDYTTTYRESSLTTPTVTYESSLETTDNTLPMPSVSYEYEVT